MQFACQLGHSSLGCEFDSIRTIVQMLLNQQMQ
jgi:hypothetical protein